MLRVSFHRVGECENSVNLKNKKTLPHSTHFPVLKRYVVEANKKGPVIQDTVDWIHVFLSKNN